MKQIFLLIFISFFSLSQLSAQKIAKIIYVGDSGIVKDTRLAKTVIIVKIHPNRSYERKDYVFNGKLIKVQNYKDSTLKVLDGFYGTYWPNGIIKEAGMYKNNQKVEFWHLYDELGKKTNSTYYPSDESKYTKEEYGNAGDSLGLVNPEYPGGDKKFRRFLERELDQDLVDKNANSCKIICAFTITKEGEIYNPFIYQSCSWKLDEDALRVVYKMPNWKPAKKNGVPIRFEIRQPITYTRLEF